MRLHKVAALVLTPVTLIALGSAKAAVPCPSRAHDPRYLQIQVMMTRQFAKGSGTALSMGIVEHGCLAWTANLGTMAPKSSIRPTEKSIYPIASVTKLFTGIMLLQLVERGTVHLTDPVVKYVPEFGKISNPYPWAPPVTLIQLATMTSGIRDDNWGTSGPDQFPSDDNDPATWDQRLAKEIPKSRFHFEPGTQREYSNAGYVILGLALSRAAHRDFIEYVTTEILKPLEMTDTSFSISPDSVSRFAMTTHMPALPSWRKDPALPAGGLFSTVDDLAKLMRFEFGLGPEAVLLHKALLQSFRLVVPSDGDLLYGDGIGYAAVRNADSDLVALGHGGETWNYIASFEYDRARQSGIIILTSDHTNAYKPFVRGGLKILNSKSTGGTGIKPTEEH
jgi:CubicO group peptidase (beta-lactamase class C family)